jgi:hypothetical protein
MVFREEEARMGSVSPMGPGFKHARAWPDVREVGEV